MDKVVVKYFRIAIMEELIACLARPTNQTSPGIYLKKRLVSRLLFILTPPSPHQLSAFTPFPHRIGLTVDYVRCVALAVNSMRRSSEKEN